MTPALGASSWADGRVHPDARHTGANIMSSGIPVSESGVEVEHEPVDLETASTSTRWPLEGTYRMLEWQAVMAAPQTAQDLTPLAITTAMGTNRGLFNYQPARSSTLQHVNSYHLPHTASTGFVFPIQDSVFARALPSPEIYINTTPESMALNANRPGLTC